MFDYKDKTALITGASSGIGLEFCRVLAAKQVNLILVARSEDRLTKLAQELAKQHNIKTVVIPTDLSVSGATGLIYQQLQAQNLQVDILINNAGFATHGFFEQISLNRQTAEIQLNVTALVELTHLILPAMLSRGEGAIINVASTAAFQPDPYMGIYGATKAFVLSFSEALWAENRKRGVRVLALCPGATDTNFFEVVGAKEASVGTKATPQSVVKVALKGLAQRKSFVIPGTGNYFLAQLQRFVPRARTAKIVEQMLRPKLPQNETSTAN